MTGRIGWKVGVAILVVALAGAVAVMAPLLLSKYDIEIKEVGRTGDALLAEDVLRGFEIASLTYRYTNLIYAEDVKKFGGFELPLTKSYFGVQYDGVMKIGVDGRKIEVSQTGHAVRIKLPEAQVISHTLVNDSIKILFNIDTIFNPNHIEDFTRLFQSKQKEMEAKAANSGLPAEARESAKAQLEQFLNTFPEIRRSCTIEWE